MLFQLRWIRNKDKNWLYENYHGFCCCGRFRPVRESLQKLEELCVEVCSKLCNKPNQTKPNGVDFIFWLSNLIWRTAFGKFQHTNLALILLIQLNVVFLLGKQSLVKSIPVPGTNLWKCNKNVSYIHFFINLRVLDLANHNCEWWFGSRLQINLANEQAAHKKLPLQKWSKRTQK